MIYNLLKIYIILNYLNLTALKLYKKATISFTNIHQYLLNWVKSHLISISVHEIYIYANIFPHMLLEHSKFHNS